MPAVLVDTSVWIRIEHRTVVVAEHVDPKEVATCPLIVGEVLRGTRDEHQYRKMRAALMLTEIFDSPTPFERFEAAARVYLKCRERGVTVGSIDCLIAATAIAHDASLMHDDSDFDLLAKIVPLRIYSWTRP